MKKKILSVFLSLFIICGVVLADYERVQAVDLPTAFWGTLEASRAWFTAMQAGGAFDRGISFNQFVNTTSSQWQEVERKTMQAYKLYLYYRYQIDITEKFPNMTVEEVRNEAIRLGTITYNSFIDKAINVSNTTKEGISVQDFKYWKEFCNEFASVAKNGIGSGSISGSVNIPIKTFGQYSYSQANYNKINNYTFEYNNKSYIYKGSILNQEYDASYTSSDRVRIPYVIASLYNNNQKFLYRLQFVDINKLTGGEIITYEVGSYSFDYNFTTVDNFFKYICDNCDFPLFLCGDYYGTLDSDVYNYVQDYTKLAVTQGTSSTLDWQYGVNDSLQNTAGQAIKDGNTKQSTKTIVKEGSVPVKRSSLKEEERNGEKVVSGEIGWDIPGTKTITAPIVDDTKEDEFIEDIGIIDVPEDIVIDDPVPGEIVIPGEEEIVIPVTPDVPIPIIKILEIQYGPFYPTAMEGLEEFFPFCIPFDIAYCVSKFRVGEGEAPVLQIPIVYPRALQGILGQSYNVTIDFNDYIALRNIIRYFILILFIVGLMTITRNIIRG